MLHQIPKPINPVNESGPRRVLTGQISITVPSMSPCKASVMKQAIATSRAPRPSAHYSPAVRSGELIVVSGQAGRDPSTREFVSGDAGQQTTQALANVRELLEEAGSTLIQVIRVGLYLSDLSNLEAVNRVYSQFFPDPPPARTTFGVMLPAGMLVMVEAMALADGK